MARFWEVLQIGFLSMIFAEVLTASSPLWFIDPFSWIVTLPLYLFHTIILINVGERLNFQKISQYYLLGTLFGLYEAWITKVLWSGYPSEDGRDAILGEYFGIAIFEFSVLVFFYHAVFSFILPVLSFQILREISVNNDLGMNSLDISISRYTKSIVFLSFLFATAIFSLNNGVNPVRMTLSLAGSLLLLFLTHLRILRLENPYYGKHLILQRRGLIISLVFLAILYSFTFVAFSPEYLPDLVGYVIVIIFYIIPIIALSISKSRSENVDSKKEEESNAVVSAHTYLKSIVRPVLIGFSLLTIVQIILPVIAIVLTVITQFAFFLIGPVLYLAMIKSATK